MNIAFIGAGKVGTALGGFFKHKGINIIGYYSRSITSAQKAAAITGTLVIDDLAMVAENADCIMITASDDMISKIAYQLSLLSAKWDEKIVIHTSGLHSSEALGSLNEKGATVCSLHPMLSFGDPLAAIQQLNDIVFTIEGSGHKMCLVTQLLDQCGVRWIEINAKDKIQYHAAACMVSNYLVTLIDIGNEMLKDIGFSNKQALELVKPLVNKTMDNIFSIGTEKALTGPISRGDVGTIKMHVDMLKEYNSAIYEIYRLIGLKTVELAQSADRIDSEIGMRIHEALKEMQNTECRMED